MDKILNSGLLAWLGISVGNFVIFLAIVQPFLDRLLAFIGKTSF